MQRCTIPFFSRSLKIQRQKCPYTENVVASHSNHSQSEQVCGRWARRDFNRISFSESCTTKNDTSENNLDRKSLAINSKAADISRKKNL